jgi:hypothetical protein
MRHILVVGDDLHVGQAIHVWPRQRGCDLTAPGNARLFCERAPTVPPIAIPRCAFSKVEISGPEFPSWAAPPGVTDQCLSVVTSGSIETMAVAGWRRNAAQLE